MGFKRLFFDIETSYNQGWFWWTSRKTSIDYTQIIKPAQIICICYKWQGSNKVYSLKWDKGEDKQIVLKFLDILLDADEAVGHNGDNFDIKWIKTRFLIHGIKSIPEIKTIDTLKISRQKFKFQSNRLDAIGKILGFGGKKDTGGIDLWHGIIQKNSKKCMDKMIAYCKRDVELLEKVFLKLEGYAKPKTHMGISENSKPDKCDCPYCASKITYLNRHMIKASGSTYVVLKCQSCGKYFSVSTKAYKDRTANELARKKLLS